MSVAKNVTALVITALLGVGLLTLAGFIPPWPAGLISYLAGGALLFLAFTWLWNRTSLALDERWWRSLRSHHPDIPTAVRVSRPTELTEQNGEDQ